MINNYISSRGMITFFDDSKDPPPIPVGASVWRKLRARPDVPQIIGEYNQDEVVECATE